MKKVCFFFFTFLSIQYCLGQSSFGVKGGLNINEAEDGLDLRKKTRFAYHGGLFFQQKLGKKLFFQPELLYSSKGYRYTSIGFPIDGAKRMNYLSVPLLIGYQASSHLSFLFGPEFDYLLRAGHRGDGGVSKVTAYYPRFDAGLDFGAAYKLSKKLSAELLYYYGFNTLYYSNRGVSYGYVKGRNKVFQAGVSYRLL
ncbi:MAG TPA: porin family protein [Flavisolibacter sp.]|jgi:hypothetical protein|nr:porin family protein [Flavisolibacter sp.]